MDTTHHLVIVKAPPVLGSNAARALVRVANGYPAWSRPLATTLADLAAFLHLGQDGQARVVEDDMLAKGQVITASHSADFFILERCLDRAIHEHHGQYGHLVPRPLPAMRPQPASAMEAISA